MRLDEAQKLAVYLVDMIGSVFIRQRSSDQYDVNFCLNSKEYTIKEFKHEKVFQKTTTQEIHQHVSQRAEMGISQLNDQRIDDQLVVRDDSSLDQQCESDQKIRETKKMAQILNSSNMTTSEIQFIKNKHTLGHYALRNKNSSTAFQNPMKSAHSIKINEDDHVVDIGAYVGEYTLFASRHAKSVDAYEASPRTFEVLKMNDRWNTNMFNLAVVGDHTEQVELHLSTGIGATNSIVKSDRKINSVVVNAINYEEAVKDASVVKIDVEGAEYTYDIIQPNLRAIILEFHPMKEFDYIQRANLIMEELRDHGFREAIKEPTFKNGWDTNSAWIRTL